MKKLLPIAVLLISVTGLSAACSRQSTAPQPGPSAIGAPSAPESTPTTVQVSGEGCLKTQPFSCWLALAAQPSAKSLREPINIAPADVAKCDSGRGNHDTCWPQPHDPIRVLCQLKGDDGKLWYGLIVSGAHVKHATSDIQGVGDDVIAYQHADHFFQPKATVGSNCAIRP